ncbi:cell division protein FtsL [Dethiosulfatarculus sandiegensis]|uniref:Cell division protein FtsL n=1 Tax=Dethiosulfatarculus sandiegensis TaxID=1429043 RepID=A0A0D2GK95_9BACT|nr:cell division protein FtsL [Dethiosulfatarculus sandiegensis]KIX15192.1 hypothetical protein X474_04685 [Dethiosulfatarculus sandiegensis]
MSISARVANKRKVKEKKNQPGVRLFSVILLVVVATCAAMFYAAIREETRRMRYQASRALEAQKDLRESTRRLRVELNHLKSPARLEKEAVRLGLVRVQPEQIRELP